mmetsp:Transcript_157533/g.277942  ORF Transcript_157533/g.277942 Transcript_157533/m.277942 type:complete len:355 (-) Transcript_157533:51-1115(-)
MSNRSGKRSAKITSRQCYEGVSASEHVRSTEWSGYSWNDANNQRSSSSTAHWFTTETTVDYNKPWFEQKDDLEWYCMLCKAYATEGHVKSDKHQKRAEDPGWYGFGDKKFDASFDKPWFEQRPDGWYCLLCQAWADEGHLTGAKHQKREQFPKEYGFVGQGLPALTCAPCAAPALRDSPLPPGWEELWSEEHQEHYYHNYSTQETQWERPCVSPAPVAAASWSPAARQQVSQTSSSAGYDDVYAKPWFVRREGEWYCSLCSSWATEGHITCEKHLKREACPEWYGFDDPMSHGVSGLPVTSRSSNVSACAAAQPSVRTLADQLPSDWESVWSEEYKQYYYHNTATGKTQWEVPK